MGRNVVVLLLALAAASVPHPASAHDLDEVVAESEDLREVQRFVALHQQLDPMLARYARLEAHAGRAWLTVVESERAGATAEGPVEAAALPLAERGRPAGPVGP